MTHDMFSGLPCAGLGLLPDMIATARGPVEVAMRPGASGRPVLALHGGMGGWDQSALLACAAFGAGTDLRVLAVSRPGYLGTPMESGRDPAAQADLYAALLDRLGIARTLVIAVSAGGPSAIAFARRHPDRAEALILVSCCTGRLKVPGAVWAGLPLMWLASKLPSAGASKQPPKPKAPEQALRRSVPDPEVRARTLAHPEAGRMLIALSASVRHRLKERLPGTIADTVRFARMGDLPAAGLHVPVLAIHGDADGIVDYEHGARMAREAPDGELMTVPGGEHVALFTDIDAVRTRIADYLTRHPG